MKSYLKAILFSFILTINISCGNKEKLYNIEFIRKYGNESFEDFINTGIVVRNNDAKGNAIIFIGDLRNSGTNGPYVVKVDTLTNLISETSCKLLQDSSLIDKTKLNDLALKFMKYKIHCLNVDSNKNVFVNVSKYNQRPSLARFSDVRFKTGIYRTDWKKLGNLWYEDELNP